MLATVQPRGTQAQATALEYVRMIRRRKWWMVASVCIVLLAAVGYSLVKSKTYTATAGILVEPVPSASSLTGATPATLGPDDVPTQQQVLGSAAVRAMVEKQLGTAGSISVGNTAGTDIITVTSNAPTPREAARVANAYATSYVAYRQAQVASSLNAAERQLQARLNSLIGLVSSYERQLANSGSSATSSQALQAQLQAALSNEGVIQSQLEELKVGAASSQGSEVVTPAKPPAAPSSPKLERNIGLGIVGGLLLGLIACVAVDRIDDSIQSKDELESLLPGTTVLGIIPAVKQWRNRERAFLVSTANPHSPAAEAYRSLRTALQFVLLDKDVRILLIVSPVPGEGKTATTANLGVAMARAGQRVLVVSGDLRRPRLGAFVGCREVVGLSSVALETAGLEEAIIPVPGVRNLWFLGAGPPSPEPAEFLASERVSKILAEASKKVDVVLVDCPPVLPFADALAASTFADAAVLVARANSSRRREIFRVSELFTNVNFPLSGVILNDVAETELNKYGYDYYRYYSGAPGHRRSRTTSATARSQGRPTDLAAGDR